VLIAVRDYLTRFWESSTEAVTHFRNALLAVCRSGATGPEQERAPKLKWKAGRSVVYDTTEVRRHPRAKMQPDRKNHLDASAEIRLNAPPARREAPESGGGGHQSG